MLFSCIISFCHKHMCADSLLLSSGERSVVGTSVLAKAHNHMWSPRAVETELTESLSSHAHDFCVSPIFTLFEELLLHNISE